MTEPRKLRVFLCHSSQDKPIVRELYHRLNAEGWIDPWLDEKKLRPGQDWETEIEKAVETTDVVIVLLSNSSVKKEGYIQKELRFALSVALEKPEDSIFIVPLRLDDCFIPRSMKSIQYVDYFPESQQESAYLRLCVSLEERANSIGISSFEIKENLRRDLEEKTRLEKEERIRQEAEERVRREEEEIIRTRAEERARKSLERKLKKQVEEKARQEKEAHVQREEEEQVLRKIVEMSRKEGADKTQRDMERIDRKQIDEKSKTNKEEFVNTKSIIGKPTIRAVAIIGVSLFIVFSALLLRGVLAPEADIQTTPSSTPELSQLSTKTPTPTLTLSPTASPVPTPSLTPTPVLRVDNIADLYIIREFGKHANSLAFSPDSKFLVTGGQLDNIVRIWEVETGEMLQEFTGHSKSVRTVAFSSLDDIVASGSSDNTVKLWDTGAQSEAFSLTDENAPLSHGVDIVGFSPDGSLLAWSPSGFPVYTILSRIVDGKILRKLDGIFLAFSPDGTQILTTLGFESAQLQSVNDGTFFFSLDEHTDWVTAGAFSYDGNFIVTAGSEDRRLYLWNAKDGSLLNTFVGGHTGLADKLAFSMDSKIIVSGGWDRASTSFWDQDGNLLHTISGSGACFAFSPDGNLFATCIGGKIQIWAIH